MHSQCQTCKYSALEDASWIRTLLDCLWLYFIGIYELVRQALQRRLHPSRFLLLTQASQGPAEQAGYLVILSGATSGIGGQIRAHLHRRGFRLIILTHPSDAGSFAGCEEVLIDFSSRMSTGRAAKQVRSIVSQNGRNSSVVFFHCAGLYNPRVGQRRGSASLGILQTYAVNTVMPALFLQSVSGLLSSIIYIGSASQKIAPTPSPAVCPFRLAKSPYSAYPLSKMLTLAYVERWSHHNSKPAIVIHPGVVDTNLYKNEQGIVGGMLQILLRFGAFRPDESAQRVLQILDETRFFTRTSTGQCPQHDKNPIGIFWDAVTMAPAMLPHQIANTSLRKQLFEHISDALEFWMDS